MARRLVLAGLAALAVLASAGCGDRLVGGDYPGEPLATLSGSMVPTPETEVSGPVRLALAWYPQWLSAEDPSGGAGAAPAIVTEDVEAEGTFPVDFRFPVYRPPPREALAPLGGGLAGRGAFGVLLAYHDGDGDRRLDPIPVDGAPVDRVVASSLLGDARSAFALVYVDAPQPGATGLRPGFNLVQGVNGDAAAVVPLDTRLRVSLTAGGPLYDAFVCEAGWLTFLLAEVCGLPGGGEGNGPAGFALSGRVALDGARLAVELGVTSEQGAHPDANVNVNGRVIPWDATRGAFVLEEEQTALVAPGDDFIVSASAAGATVGRVLAMPGELALETPAEGAVLRAADPLVLRWSASAGATSYFAGFEALGAGSATLAEPGALEVTLDATGARVGAASAFVEARLDPLEAEAFVTTAVVRRRSFWMTE